MLQHSKKNNELSDHDRRLRSWLAGLFMKNFEADLIRLVKNTFLLHGASSASDTRALPDLLVLDVENPVTRKALAVFTVLNKLPMYK